MENWLFTLNTALGTFVFAYVGYLCWFKADYFRGMIKGRIEKWQHMPFKKTFLRWSQSDAYLWVLRILMLVLFINTARLFYISITGVLAS